MVTGTSSCFRKLCGQKISAELFYLLGTESNRMINIYGDKGQEECGMSTLILTLFIRDILPCKGIDLPVKSRTRSRIDKFLVVMEMHLNGRKATCKGVGEGFTEERTGIGRSDSLITLYVPWSANFGQFVLTVNRDVG